MKSCKAKQVVRAAACVALTGLLIPCAVKGQAPFVPPPPAPASGGQLPPPPPGPAGGPALPPPAPPSATPFAPPGAPTGSPFAPAAGPGGAAAPSGGRPRLLRRQRGGAEPREKGRLRERLRGLFRGGNAGG